MLDPLISLLKRFFGREKPSAPEPQKFTIPHAWPFKTEAPPDADALIREMIRGVRTEDGHTFYYYRNKKCRHLRTPQGRETHVARNIVWWMEGRKHPETANGLQTTCGEPKCIKLSHLSLVGPRKAYGPEKPKPPAPVRHVPKAKQPPQPKTPKGGQRPKLTKGDRSKCPTRKVYFSTKHEAQVGARKINDPKIRGKGRRVYPYDTACPYCFGWHLTKMKPGTYNRTQIKNSAW
jgi:hypothetical protein